MATTVLNSHKRGDTFLGISEIEVLINGVAVDITGASILMQLKKVAGSSDVAKEFSTDNALITITDATAGKFAIESCIIDIIPFNYVYDIEVTLATGRVLTVVEGTWEILADVSRV